MAGSRTYRKDRDAFVDVGAAIRQAVARASAAQLTNRQWRTLLGLVAVVASWSRLWDNVYTIEIAKAVGLDAKNLRQDLAKLRDAGVIIYEPAQGRGFRSRIGLPAAPASSTNGREREEVGEDELADYTT